MKKIFAIIIFIFILTGCAEEHNFTEKQRAACDLVKEFVVFQSPETVKESWVQCLLKNASEYSSNDEIWVAISPKPSKKHPNYENYLKNKKIREENNMPEPPSTLLIDAENDMIMDPNISDPEAGRFFIKSEDGFVRPTKDELVNIYGEKIFK